MIRADVIVLGAGIAGVSVSLHLQQRGRTVLLVDRRDPGEETSYGNAGIIQREGVVPYPFPRDPALLFRYALNRLPEANLHWPALPRIALTRENRREPERSVRAADDEADFLRGGMANPTGARAAHQATRNRRRRAPAGPRRFGSAYASSLSRYRWSREREIPSRRAVSLLLPSVFTWKPSM